MSLGIVVYCESSHRYGTCAALLYTGARTEAEAYEAAARAGWDVGRGRDYCPGHSHRPRPTHPPTPLRPLRST